jgi:hypothetical protein
MDYKKFFLAAIVFTIVNQIVHTVGAMLTMDYYMDPNYFSVWSKLMMPAAGAPPAEFFFYSIGFGFIIALIYTYVYTVLKKAVPGADYVKKGLSYGALLFLIANIPGTLSMMLLLNLPLGLLVGWAIEGLVIALLGGIIIAKFLE